MISKQSLSLSRLAMAIGVVAICLFGCSSADSTAREDVMQGDDAGIEKFRRGMIAGNGDHAAIITESLGFLRSTIVSELGEQAEIEDTIVTDNFPDDDGVSNDPWHFDDCELGASTANVNSYIRMATDEANDYSASGAGSGSEYYSDVVKKFGVWLHITQDFFAHSNFMEYHYNKGQEAPVVASDSMQWPPFSHGDVFAGMLVWSGNENFPAWLGSTVAHSSVNTVSDNVYERLPEVYWSSNGVTRNMVLLVTAVSGDNRCPSWASIPHSPCDEPVFGGLYCNKRHYFWSEYLAKDDPDSYLHTEAIEAAKRQTKEEFCRLDRSVQLRYGQESLTYTQFHSAFVTNETSFLATCPRNRAIVASLQMTAVFP